MRAKMLSRLTVRSVVVIILVVGAFVLTIADHNFRPTFGDLAKLVLGATSVKCCRKQLNVLGIHVNEQSM